jgi:hypothetical protein
MKAIRRGERVELDVARYVDDPVGLARDAFGIELWSRQAELVSAVASYDRVTCRAGHKLGKSLAVAVIVWWFVLTRSTGRAVIVAPTARQIRGVDWREVKALHKRARIKLDCEVHDVPERGVQFADGREIIGFTSDTPERFAGVSGDELLIVVDEASGISAELFEAITGTVAGGAKLVLTGNPTQSAGPFYDSHHTADYWHRLAISSEESPNVVAGKRLIPGLATSEWIEERRADWGAGSPLYAVRVLGEYPSQASNAVVSLDLIERATSEWSKHAYDESAEPLRIGVDVARFGDDESVIVCRRGLTVGSIVARRGLDSIRLAAEVARAANGERAIVNVDEGGVGGGVVDQLKLYRNLTVHGINAGSASGNAQYARKRDELWFSIVDYLKAGGTFPDDAKLTGELVAVEYSFSPSGKIVVEPKDDLRRRLGRSPDRADALALATYEARHDAARLFRDAMKAVASDPNFRLF